MRDLLLKEAAHLEQEEELGPGEHPQSRPRALQTLLGKREGNGSSFPTLGDGLPFQHPRGLLHCPTKDVGFEARREDLLKKRTFCFPKIQRRGCLSCPSSGELTLPTKAHPWPQVSGAAMMELFPKIQVHLTLRMWSRLEMRSLQMYLVIST